MPATSDKLKLRRCPFCGGKADIDEDAGTFWIRCKKCPCGTYTLNKKRDAIAAWNNRQEVTTDEH